MFSSAGSVSCIAQLVYFMAPAYVANMVPPFTRCWSGWNRPISKRWLGSHKTVLGFGSGVLAGVLVTFVQSRIAWKGALVNDPPWLTLGLRLGGGAMLGDSAKSFVKRRVGIPPGKPWIPWDQLDFVIGALALVARIAPLTRVDVLAILLVSLTGHILVTRLGYWAGIRDVRW